VLVEGDRIEPEKESFVLTCGRLSCASIQRDGGI